MQFTLILLRARRARKYLVCSECDVVIIPGATYLLLERKVVCSMKCDFTELR